jgi:hypothetical protein
MQEQAVAIVVQVSAVQVHHLLMHQEPVVQRVALHH